MEFKRWDIVDKHELKLMAIRCFLIGLCCSILAFILFNWIMKNIFISEMASIGILLGSIYISVIVYKRDWLDEKVGLFDPYLQGISYQGTVILLIAGSIMFTIGFFGLAFVKGGIYSAISTSLCVNFPIIFMLLKSNVYHNSRLLYVGKLNGMDHYEQVLGYFPIFYYCLLGIPFSWSPLGVSFKKILESIFLHNGFMEYSVLCFILCLLAGSFILSPDIENNVFPFEIRTLNGYFKFSVISWILMGICLIPLII